ncbi:MAG: ribosome-associated translation inhibitor RaiA [Patescibacteria group bacterium]|jgi:putative sigma-54 modulation protein
MKITIYHKKIELTDKLYDYVQEKVGGLEQYIDNVIECFVELDEDTSMKSGKKFRCEVQMKVPRSSIRAEEIAYDIFEAIDLVIPKLTKQIEKYKGTRSHPRGIKSLN